VCLPQEQADLAFTMHILSWLAVNGTAAIVEFPGVLYRSGAEQKIRKYLIDNNYVDAVIQLPPDLFFGTTIATCVIVLKKSKPTTRRCSSTPRPSSCAAATRTSSLPPTSRKSSTPSSHEDDADHFARLVDNADIADNDYNLSVSSYVEERTPRGCRHRRAQRRDRPHRRAAAELRTAIDEIVADLESSDR
jgi:type I restriction enzyme M protein